MGKEGIAEGYRVRGFRISAVGEQVVKESVSLYGGLHVELEMLVEICCGVVEGVPHRRYVQSRTIGHIHIVLLIYVELNVEEVTSVTLEAFAFEIHDGFLIHNYKSINVYRYNGGEGRDVAGRRGMWRGQATAKMSLFQAVPRSGHMARRQS